MKKTIPTISACAVVAGSCLIWISGITLSLVHFLELSSTEGWVIAIALGASSMLALAIILYEMSHAIDLEDQVDLERIPSPNPWSLPYLYGRGLSASGS